MAFPKAALGTGVGFWAGESPEQEWGDREGRTGVACGAGTAGRRVTF